MSIITDRSQQPEIKPIQKITVEQVQKSTLDNGIPVYSISAGFQDVIRVEFVFPNPQFNPSKPLLTHTTNKLLQEGTSKHTARQLADMIDFYGAFYETEQSADYCSVVLLTLNKHLEKTLPIIYEIITDAIFPESELSVYVQNNKQRLIVENERVQSVARRKYNEMLFGGNHPYGFNVQPGDFDNINQDDVKNYHRKNYKGNRCSILLSGIVHDTSFKIINNFFGHNDWSGEPNHLPVSYATQSSKEHKSYVEKDNAIQTALRIGKLMVNKIHPDYPGLQVLNTLLGGFFGSRLMKNIREDKGYTYGIGSAVVSMVHGGYFFISSEVGSDVTVDAIKEIYKEVKLLKEELVTKDELDIVKNFILGSFLKNIDGPFNLMDRWKGLMLYDLGYDYYQRYIDTVRSTTPEVIINLAKKYFDEENFFELVVGKK